MVESRNIALSGKCCSKHYYRRYELQLLHKILKVHFGLEPNALKLGDQDLGMTIKDWQLSNEDEKVFVSAIQGIDNTTVMWQFPSSERSQN